MWQLCISGTDTTSARCEALVGFTHQPGVELLPELWTVLNKCSSSIPVYFLLCAYSCTSQWRQVYEAHQVCLWCRSVSVVREMCCSVPATRASSRKPPLCGSDTNTCTGRLSCSVYTDSVCVSQGRQCQCRSCVQCY